MPHRTRICRWPPRLSAPLRRMVGTRGRFNKRPPRREPGTHVGPVLQHATAATRVLRIRRALQRPRGTPQPGAVRGPASGGFDARCTRWIAATRRCDGKRHCEVCLRVSEAGSGASSERPTRAARGPCPHMLAHPCRQMRRSRDLNHRTAVTTRGCRKFRGFSPQDRGKVGRSPRRIALMA